MHLLDSHYTQLNKGLFIKSEGVTIYEWTPFYHVIEDEDILEIKNVIK